MNFINKILIIALLVIFVTPLEAQWIKIQNIPPNFRNSYWLDVYFLESNPRYGWVCGHDGRVMRTTDMGESWTGTVIPNGGQLESIHFASERVGYCSGNGKIYKSIDGGISWFDVTDRRATSPWGCYFVDENNGILVGGGCSDPQQFFKTTNGGASWILFEANYPNSGLTDVELYDKNGLGYAVSSGRVWQTTDGGKTWFIFANSGSLDWQEEFTKYKNSFLFPYSQNCSGGGPGGMRFSTDNGRTFRDTYVGKAMFGAFLLDELRGWACGWEQSVYYTSDGGKSWVLKNCGIDDANLDDIWFINDTLGFVVGEGIFKYTINMLNVSITALGTTSFCEGDSVVLTPTNNYKYYRWSTGDTTKSLVVKKSGTYYLVAGYIGCDSSQSNKITVNVYPAPDATIDAFPRKVLCEEDTLILSARNTKGLKYFWSTGDTTLSIKITNPGKYTLNIIDSNGCSNSNTFEIKRVKNPAPTIQVNGSGKSCIGYPIKLTTQSGYQEYIWVDSLKNEIFHQGSNTTEVHNTGYYYVIVKDNNGCYGKSDAIFCEFILDSNALVFSINPEKDFFIIDTTNYLIRTCKDLKITNNSARDFYLHDIFVYFNTEFSIPQSQFPIILKPYETKELTICFSPKNNGLRTDTIFIQDNCGIQKIILKSITKPNTYETNSQCDKILNLITQNLVGKYYFVCEKPYPNPTPSIAYIPFYIAYLKNENPQLEAKLYNFLGEFIMNSKLLINKEIDYENYKIAEGEFQLDMNNFETGYYFVVIKINQSINTFKILVLKN